MWPRAAWCSTRGRNLSDRFDPNDSDRDLQSIGVASTLGFGIAVSLAVLAGGGVWLDTRFDTAPLWSLVGLTLGLIAAGYQLYELVLASQKHRENGPLGKALQRKKPAR